MGRHIGTTQNNNFLLVKIENAKIKMLELHKLSILFFVMFMKKSTQLFTKNVCPLQPMQIYICSHDAVTHSKLTSM